MRKVMDQKRSRSYKQPLTHYRLSNISQRYNITQILVSFKTQLKAATTKTKTTMDSRKTKHVDEGQIRGTYPIGFSQDDNPRAIPAPPLPKEWKHHAPIFGDLIKEVLRLRVQRLYDHKRLSETTTITNGRIQIVHAMVKQQNEVMQRMIDKQDAVLQYARSTTHLMQAIITEIAQGRITGYLVKCVDDNIAQGRDITTPGLKHYGAAKTARQVQERTLETTVTQFERVERNVRNEMDIPPLTRDEQFQDTHYGVQLDPTRINIRRHSIPDMNEQPWQYDPANNMKTCLLTYPEMQADHTTEPPKKRSRTKEQPSTEGVYQQHVQNNQWPYNAYEHATTTTTEQDQTVTTQ
jgi:hypothetical protein